MMGLRYLTPETLKNERGKCACCNYLTMRLTAVFVNDHGWFNVCDVCAEKAPSWASHLIKSENAL